MAIICRSRRFLKKSLLWLAGITVALIVILGLLNVAAQTHQEVAYFVQTMSSFESVARYIRWGFLGAVIMFWDQIAELYGKAKGFDDVQIQRAQAMRWRVAVFIIAFEFVVVEAVPARLMS
jgi:hypothetical protein